MNAKMKSWYQSWKTANPTENIYDVYERPSREKVIAAEQCIDRRLAYDGKFGKIIAHNTFFFTYAYIRANFETGEIEFVVETASNIYTALVSELEA